jgi:hypothetical protein
MANKKKLATTVAATFGAALGSMYLAPELQADILDITWNGGDAGASHEWRYGVGNNGPQIMDQVPLGFNPDSHFNQFNSEFGGGNGRTMFLGELRGIFGAGIFSASDDLTANMFTAAVDSINASAFAGTGTAFVGFQDLNGNVGWFAVSFTEDGTIFYGPGQYGNAGETVHVGGGGAVPEPGTAGALALLALGAAGVRRKRKVA